MDKDLKDKTLLRIAIATAFIGLVALLILMFMTDIKEKKIAELNDSDIGKSIKIAGNIISIRHNQDNKTTFMKLSQECIIDIISFDNLNMMNGTYVTVQGKMQEYNGNIELIADKIESIK